MTDFITSLAPDHVVDVLICGGGLAGLTLARQLRQTLPQLEVVVLERTTRPLPAATHKVGESSVELGSQYLEQLGLGDYLATEHYLKFGLRFFPGGGDRPINERMELGPAADPVVRSYQIDRGRFEADLRGMIEADGATLVEGAKVLDVDVGSGEEPHRVRVELDGAERSLRARWLVDATGRRALLRRQLKLKRGTKHPASAGWFRVEGRIDVNELASPEAREWHDAPFAEQRWLSTNHLMGEGYWVWLIPLSSGKTSVGVVVHNETHGFDAVRTLDRVKAFIAEHEPHLAARLEGEEVLDFLCLDQYSHNVARSWSADRWALTGEAGAFVDPLYSPGTDFIGFANSFTVEIIENDLTGEYDLVDRCRRLTLQYRALVSGAVDVFRDAAPVFGHGRAMAAKVYWDNFSYWSYPCQYYLQGIYKLSSEAHAPFDWPGQRFVELSGYVQTLMRLWAEMAPEAPQPGFVGMPAFPSLLVDAHLALQDEMTPDETLAYMTRRAREGNEIVAELVMRVVQELGPEKGAALLDKAQLQRWNLDFDPDRFAAEELRGLKRRHALSPAVRDIERTLGRVRKHPQAAEALDLLRPRPAA